MASRSGVVRGSWLAAALVLAAMVAGSVRVSAAAEDEARATFVLLLGKYVSWPASAFETPTSPIVVSVIGNASLAAEMRKLAVGQQFEGRAVEVREASDASAAGGSHIVFVSDAVQSSALSSAAVVRVFEKPNRLADTDIAIRMQGGRVAFAVNRNAVAKRGLKLSSKLMKLASAFE